MAWRNQGDDNKFFGMTEEEVKAKLTAGETSAAKVVELEGKITEQGSKLDSITTTLGDIAGRLPPVKTEDGGNGGEGGNHQEIDPNDPEQVRAARDSFVVQSGLEAKAFNTFQTVARKLRKKEGIIFDRLEEEVQELLSKSPLQQQIIPEVVENAYLIVKGKHADEIANDRANKKGNFYIESAVNQGSSGTDKPLTPEEQLSQDELKAARNTGVTPEQYLKQKQAMNSMPGVLSA